MTYTVGLFIIWLATGQEEFLVGINSPTQLNGVVECRQAVKALTEYHDRYGEGEIRFECRLPE